MPSHTPLVSIIVPVYNAEKYLSRCIESVLIQSYNKLELILVNDGSSDTSLSIAYHYAQQDDRILVVENSKNLGTMRSRDNGIRSSHGEWITFLDSDDWLPETAIESFVFSLLDDDADVAVAARNRYLRMEPLQAPRTYRCRFASGFPRWQRP